MSSQIDWSKSFFITRDQVATLGLEGVSVNDMDKPQEAVALADAMERLTVTDLGNWAREMDI